MVTIQNSELTVEIDPLGAQLASICTPDGEEYLWQGDPDIWARRAPLLFPIIGRLRGGTYWLDGTPYAISNHGFARDTLFQIVQQSGSSVSFQITDTEETRRVYPFSFVLTVTYALEGSRLIKTHRVENRSGGEMYYELGGHDGFRIPAGSGMADWAILLPGLDRVQLYPMDQDLMVAPRMEPIPLDHRGGLPLTPASYGQDTMILDAPPQGKAVLADPRGCPRVTLEFPDFPYLGIWTQNKPYDTGYVCIEPWTTLPDATFVGRELPEKAGIRRLPAGGSETLQYITTIHS